MVRINEQYDMLTTMALLSAYKKNWLLISKAIILHYKAFESQKLFDPQYP